MPLFGPPNVEKLKAKRDIAGLVKALSYKNDWGVRQAAAEALTARGADPRPSPADTDGTLAPHRL